MGYFDNLSKTQVYSKSKYFQEGTYLVKIVKTQLKKGHKGESFIIETEVLGARSDHDAAPDVGQMASHVWNAGKEMAIPTLMEFMCALYGVESPQAVDDAVWEKRAKKVFGKNGAEGQVMRLDVFMTTTKAGNDFTVHRWLRVATDADFEEFDVDPDAID